VNSADDLRRPMILPPWWRGGAPREPLSEAFSRARWLLATYWLLLVSGYVVLLGVAFRYWGPAEELLVLLPVLVGASTLGVALGNLLALLRLRAWMVHSVVWFAIVTLTCTVAIAAGPLLAGGAIAFLTSVSCGHAAMQRRALLTTLWIPALCWVGAMLTVIDQHGGVRHWEIGLKDGVWDPTTLALLAMLVMLYFAFLAGQARYHHAVWAAGATDTQTTLTQHQRGAALRMTRRGGLSLILLALIVTAAVAAVAPYLWRTGERDGHRPGEGTSDARSHDRRLPAGDPDRPGRSAPRLDAQALRDALSRAARRAREQAEAVLPFFPLFFLNRPVRRWWRLRRLRRGGRTEEPTKRALRRWEYVTVALGDVGIRVLPGDTVEELVEKVRAQREARGLPSIPELGAAAAEVDRVRFGLGIPVGTLEALETHAVRAYKAIRGPMTPWQRVSCWWRRMT
jgi:hypothetical protein